MQSKENSFPTEIKLGDNIYTFVWGDEFDGPELNSSKWTWSNSKSRMHPSDPNEMINVDDERAISLKDGKLCMTASVISENPDGGRLFGVPASVSTDEKMSYVYGYCEIRAKVPFGKGLWPGFWAVSDKKAYPKNDRKYITEIDVFEIFGKLDGVVPNIHKWYSKDVYPYDEIFGTNFCNHTMFSSKAFNFKERKIYYFAEHQSDISDLSNEFHTYGFEWTPEEMSMYVDGEKYMTFDIVNSYDDCDDMSGFHEPIMIIFNNFLFVPSSDWIPEFEQGVPNLITDCLDNLPSVYEVDYFRLYQNKSVADSKLYLRD